VSEVFWQAKIWGLLHDPALKALHNNSGRGENSFWQQLEVMQTWRDNGWNPETSGGTLLKHIHLADYITSASDRGAIGSISNSINYAPSHDQDKGLEISHLLSGKKLHFKIKQHSELLSNRRNYLQQKETDLLQAIPTEVKTDIKQLFWWLWRCLPQATCDLFQDESLLLMPAETRLPDSSIWSHASLTAALAGALTGYDLTTAAIERWSSDKMTLSHPYLATFTFSPVQELIKASRKMRDFWAGSWILHYLSAKVSWKLASIYGPDTLLYPSLYQQPLIDHWLLQKWPEFKTWVKQPSQRSLLTAGFPNVLVLVLPKDKVSAAMQTAEQTILETWRDLGKRVFEELHEEREWMPSLQPDSNTWKGWLEVQWQTYWTAIPIGKEGESIKNAAIPEDRQADFQPWLDTQNQAYNLTREKEKLFQPAELNFLRAAYQQRLEKQGKKFSVNVGSWWPHIFDQTRYALTTVKNARNWQIPTAFGPRSTISGLGPVVHPGADWVTEGDTKKYWQRQAGLFDGTEQLNATETLKRGLEKILPQLLIGGKDQPSEEEIIENIAASYPDLTAGVAGYLKVHTDADLKHRHHFHQACQAILDKFDWAEKVIKRMRSKWGVSWIDDSSTPQKYHSRFLNAGWLVEDAESEELEEWQKALKRENDPAISEQLRQEIRQLKVNYRQQIQKIIDQYYPSNNPADWYVLGAGDGDGMSEWLKGKKLKNYRDYVPSNLSAPAAIQDTFDKFLELPKRMGPSTHSALSRALLDFSNQLVPYLTERRYAGRLIYGGGDDVLAYTNLWEWDKWLWDIRQCFRGADDKEKQEFKSEGDYWHWQKEELPKDPSGKALLSSRPLFTMGHQATISFGIAIAHHSVPLAITLENLWKAEEEAKEHKYNSGCSLKNKKNCYTQKDAVQIRVLYGNGNILKATAKFDVFHLWQQLLNTKIQEQTAIFEQAATLWSQHPAPVQTALSSWTKAFCARRELFANDDSARDAFQQHLAQFLDALWQTTSEKNLDREIQNWLKLAAFVIRNRTIKLGGQP
jgi:CRISPR-associated protein Cmr2